MSACPEENLEEKRLPDGGFEMRCGQSLPVVLTAATYFSRTAHQRWQIVAVLMVYAGFFAKLRGTALPLTSGRFREAGEEFVWEDSADPAGPFARLRVPRRIVVSGEMHPHRP